MATTHDPQYTDLKTVHESAVARFDLSGGDTHKVLTLTGAWTKETVPAVDDALRALGASQAGIESFTLKFENVGALDTVGAWAVRRLLSDLEHANIKTEMQSPPKRLQTLLRSVEDIRQAPVAKKTVSFVEKRTNEMSSLGHFMSDVMLDIFRALGILGAIVRGAKPKSGRGQGVRFSSIVHHVDHMGVQAVPIIVLMSIIIGAIIAQQGAFQLKYFGAEIFVVDLVGILVLREIGVLLTAIMVAGRTGSAITAEIGSMRMREEIDALRVMGLSPIAVLVLPRLIALVIALPLLTIIANFAALGGAAFVAYAYSDIGFGAFMTRLHAAIDITSVAAGLIKAPFMAIIIGIVAALEGLKVGGSAESLGKHVTSSVVKAIFVVIVVDGVFAMFYAAIDF